jgi:pyruvate/2-oxoglutarate dehydrogenase complex dihydrolipoamide dehydrogenase (E3) component
VGSRLDWPAVVARQHAIVKQLGPPTEKLERTGARVYLGEARLADAHTVTLDGRALHGEKILIAAGSAPVVPPLPGHELTITSDALLFLPDFPATLILVGAGPIGLEMAGAFNDLGARVTVLAQEEEILPTFDRDVAAYLRAMLEVRGVVFRLGARVSGFSGRPGDVVTRFTQGGGAHELRATTVCLAVGRRFDPRMLGAEGLGLETSRLGLATTPHLRTSLPHIYAAGDAAGNVQLTPTAAHEGRVAAQNALQGDGPTPDLTVVPQAIFTTPEIARVGLGHREARERGVHCHVTTHDMKGASNGVATGEDGGYLKLVFEAKTEKILGVQMVSYAAAELIQLAALAIRAGATANLLSTQLSIHPSHAERFIKVSAHEFHEVCEL